MIELITPENVDPTFDGSKLFKLAHVHLDEVLKPQPVAISIGESTYKGNVYPIPFGSYGDYSCIVGPSKSKKTFLKSALLACYQGGHSQTFFPNIKGHHANDRYILDVDTEQSEFHSQRTFRRVPEMVGGINELYQGFSLRRFSPYERLQFVEWLINESQYRNKIGIISIDGYADLVNDYNSLTESNDLTSKLLKWSAEAHCHITGILHKNFGTEKPVGHIGSAVLKKAETVAFIEQDADNAMKVVCKYSRNYSFNDFSFMIDNDHLPRDCSEETYF